MRELEVTQVVPLVGTVFSVEVVRGDTDVRVVFVDGFDGFDESLRDRQFALPHDVFPCLFEDDVHTVRRVRHGLFRVFGHGRGEVRRLLLPVVDDGVDLVGVVGPDDVLLHDVAP